MDMKDLAATFPRQAHRVSVGAEGWQQDNGFLSFRTSKQTFVVVTASPSTLMRPVPVVTLALAIAPAYGR
jgi:hypothetical protein